MCCPVLASVLVCLIWLGGLDIRLSDEHLPETLTRGRNNNN